MASPMPNGRQQYFNQVGAPLAGGKIHTYAAGTTTPKATFTTAAGTVENENPTTLDARGEAAIFWDGSYYVEVKDALGNLIYSVDNYSDPEQAANVLRAQLLASTGATHIGYGGGTVNDRLDAGPSSAQIAAQLGYEPVNPNSAIIGGKATAQCASTTFNAADGNTLEVRAEAGVTDCANMQFVRPSAYGIKLGLRDDNTFCLGGYSMGAGVYRLTSNTAGDLTALGNVTAYSDMRFKTEIEPIGSAVERTLQMRGFRYLDTRTGEHKIGVGAQEVVKAGFPEATVTDGNGHLSVAYGQLALALLIENTRELHARIAQLESQLKG